MEPTSPSVAQSVAQPVTVSIYGQPYHLRGVDPEHIEQLAAVVDAKMRAVSAHGQTVDSLRIAVLAALNIADELTSLRARYEQLTAAAAAPQPNLHSRAGSLADMLDEVLKDPAARRVG